MDKQSADQLLKNQVDLVTASVNWNPEDDIREDSLAWTEEYLRLPKSIRYGMLSDQTSIAVAKIAQNYKIYDYKKIGEVSRIIREVFTRGVREREIVQRVKEKIGLSDLETGHMLKDIQSVVAMIKQLGEEELAQSTEKIAIIPALKQYPQLGEQKICESTIKLKVFDEPVQPTIKNWLEDYFSRIGTDKHTAMERSDFLFNSENGKPLNGKERDQVGMILKSYDTDEPLVVHTLNQEVMFSERPLEQGSKKVPNLAPSRSVKPPAPVAPVLKPKPIEPQATSLTMIAQRQAHAKPEVSPATKSLKEVSQVGKGDVKFNPMELNVGKNSLIFPLNSFTMIDPNKEAAKHARERAEAKAKEKEKEQNQKPAGQPDKAAAGLNTLDKKPSPINQADTKPSQLLQRPGVSPEIKKFTADVPVFPSSGYTPFKSVSPEPGNNTKQPEVSAPQPAISTEKPSAMTKLAVEEKKTPAKPAAKNVIDLSEYL